MKYYSKIFDLFLYQSLFIPFFGILLYILEDPIYLKLFTVASISAIIATVLGIAGIFLDLFVKSPKEL